MLAASHEDRLIVLCQVEGRGNCIRVSTLDAPQQLKSSHSRSITQAIGDENMCPGHAGLLEGRPREGT